MQKLFSMFPSGVPGVGLVLLRVSVVVTSLSHAAGRVADFGADWPMALLLLPAVLLVIGFLTPALAVLSAIWAVAALPGAGLDGTLAAGLSILNAAALAMLGPGAYSVDARLFGRRIVVLPADRCHEPSVTIPPSADRRRQ